MPTREQLAIIWESQYEYFGGSGQPVQTYGVNFDDNGLTTTKHIDTLVTLQNHSSDFEGETIGTISFDPTNKDLKVTPIK